MRNKLLIGNLKLNGTKESIAALLQSLKKGIATFDDKTPQVVVLPPFVFMQQASETLQTSLIALGGQNMSEHPKGAYTGEISAEMLKSFGCRYVLLGHSERRQYHGEQEEMIARKVILAQEIGLTPILCIGETQEAHQSHKTEGVLCKQLSFYFKLKKDIFKNLVIAYEPIWAVGKDEGPTPSEVQTIHQQLRLYIGQQIGFSLAQQICMLYGGGVKSDNARALFSMPDVDGALIGRAALSEDAFLQIYRSFL